ncbi:MAG: hypothetical protein NTX82_02640 [Candidatus Parcubacteria bacterium]|nr:hypothetical protein [Candidatus Parcubacteria bacterium]
MPPETNLFKLRFALIKHFRLCLKKISKLFKLIKQVLPRHKIILFICPVLFGLLTWKLNLLLAILIIAALLSFIYGWNSLIFLAGTILALVICLISLIFRQNTFAETMSIYAFYFLFITVILQFKKNLKKNKHAAISKKNM